MIGLFSAMEEEVQLFRQHLQTKQTVVFAGISFQVGTIQDIDVILASCGVGKVNAAAATQLMIDKFDVTAVICTGLAGALVPYLKRGDVVISNFVGQHDVDLTAFGRRPGQVSDRSRLIEADPHLVQLAADAFEESSLSRKDSRQVVVGTIVTGDSFIHLRRVPHQVAAARIWSRGG